MSKKKIDNSQNCPEEVFQKRKTKTTELRDPRSNLAYF